MATRRRQENVNHQFVRQIETLLSLRYELANLRAKKALLDFVERGFDGSKSVGFFHFSLLFSGKSEAPERAVSVGETARVVRVAKPARSDA